METRLKSFNQFVNTNRISESLQYHLDNELSIAESVFRPGSDAHLQLLSEARELFFAGQLNLTQTDRSLFEETDLGKFGFFEGTRV